MYFGALMPDLVTYRTIRKPAHGEYKEKGSKFIAHAFPAATEEEVEEFLGAMRREYHDARHHCYAYRLGADGLQFRANDDGEPNHSAGDPILGQIRSFELTNVLVVVIRYFGGTKLGVSGLIHAYRTAADEALRTADIAEAGVTAEYVIDYPYDSTNEVMRLFEEVSASVVNQEFTEKCVQDIKVNVALKSTIEAKVRLLQQLGHQITLVQKG